MKRIISVLLMTVLMTVYLQAENAVKSFETHRQGATGGMIDDEIVFIYHKNAAKLLDNEFLLELFKETAREQICSGEETRDIVEKYTKRVIYIYLHENRTTIVKIDSCDGIELEKE